MLSQNELFKTKNMLIIRTVTSSFQYSLLCQIPKTNALSCNYCNVPSNTLHFTGIDISPVRWPVQGSYWGMAGSKENHFLTSFRPLSLCEGRKNRDPENLGRGKSWKNSVGVCDQLPKTLTLFITKRCDSISSINQLFFYI